MSDYAPPPGPPPPKVPEGWKAIWNDQYKEWFYVNLSTKESTWEKPTAPASSGTHTNQPDQLPSYSSGPNAPIVSDTKKPLESNNPYAHETDEQMARRLQAEESSHTASAQGHGQSQDRGASDSYYNQSFAGGGGGGGGGAQLQQQPPGIQGGYPGGPQSATSPYSQQQYSQPQNTSSGGDKGFLGKLKNKFGGSSSRPQGNPSQGMGAGGYGGGYPQQQPYGGGYGGYPQQQQAMYAQQPMKKKGGMGAGGAAALGVGGGLIGGMLLADAIEDHDDHEYDEGYQDGMDDGGDFGGDF